LTSIRNLRLVALAEATSYLALLIAAGFKEIGSSSTGSSVVSVLGPIHGIIFLAYVFLTIVLRTPQSWSAKTTLLILLGAVIPFGGYYVDWWLKQNAR
jgi:integral membrane protein